VIIEAFEKEEEDQSGFFPPASNDPSGNELELARKRRSVHLSSTHEISMCPASKPSDLAYLST
jgi:hypothetical protein